MITTLGIEPLLPPRRVFLLEPLAGLRDGLLPGLLLARIDRAGVATRHFRHLFEHLGGGGAGHAPVSAEMQKIALACHSSAFWTALV